MANVISRHETQCENHLQHVQQGCLVPYIEDYGTERDGIQWWMLLVQPKVNTVKA